MTGSRVHLVSIRGLEIEVEEAGVGERAFVLVHGYTGSRDDFLEQIPRLASLGRTIALDQRGHGGSTNTGVPDGYQLDALADDLDATLTALGIRQCDLLGHSMGGMVALRFVLAHPERVQSLVLMDTVARPFRFLPPNLLEGSKALIAAEGMKGLAAFMRKSKRPRSKASLRFEEELGSDRYWGRIQAKIEAMDRAAYETLGGLAYDGVLDRLGEITCPTLVMVGEEDVVFLDPADELTAGIPGARRVTIPNAAHSPQHENADAWFEAIRAHLARVRVSARP